ncbi:MAG: Pr6Pr family membrane protein [Gemmatimonadaceae bacterium]
MGRISRAEALFLFIASIVAWSGIFLQVWLSTVTFGSVLPAIWRLVSYFTILTNIITAVFFTMRFVKRNQSPPNWTQSDSVATCVCANIVFVGLGFILLLARLYSFEGLAWLTNALFHYVTPALGLIFWLAFVRSGALKWKEPLAWSIYLIVYGLYAIARGTASGFYPYPFLEVPVIGYGQVAINMFGLLAAFCILAILFVFVGRRWPIGSTEPSAP